MNKKKTTDGRGGRGGIKQNHLANQPKHRAQNSMKVARNHPNPNPVHFTLSCKRKETKVGEENDSFYRS